MTAAKDFRTQTTSVNLGRRAGSRGGAPPCTLCLPCPSQLGFQSAARACLWPAVFMTTFPVMPTAALPMVIPVIEILAIMTAYLVVVPMRVAVLEILPINRMGVIPPFPSRTIPVAGSDDIGFGIGVIRGLSISWAKKSTAGRHSGTNHRGNRPTGYWGQSRAPLRHPGAERAAPGNVQASPRSCRRPGKLSGLTE